MVFAMEKGEISDVFETPFGYHLAMVEDVTSAATVPLEDVRDSILKNLLEGSRTEAVNRYVEELRQQAEISPHIPSPS